MAVTMTKSNRLGKLPRKRGDVNQKCTLANQAVARRTLCEGRTLESVWDRQYLVTYLARVLEDSLGLWRCSLGFLAEGGRNPALRKQGFDLALGVEIGQISYQAKGSANDGVGPLLVIEGMTA
jgi:hypothetical protein